MVIFLGTSNNVGHNILDIKFYKRSMRKVSSPYNQAPNLSYCSDLKLFAVGGITFYPS